jgi:type I restriction enzyme R subunit
MSLNESIVEEAALEWFGELGYAVGHGPHLVPGEPAAERDSFGKRPREPLYSRRA